MTGEQENQLFRQLGRIEARLDELAGNGQPGRVGKLETAVHHLEDWVSEHRGRTGAFAAIAGLVGAALLEVALALVRK